MEILTKKVEETSTLEEKCLDGGNHTLKPFIYEGKKSDFEEYCKRCGGYRIDPKGIYSHIGLIHYVDSERYKSLLKLSESIKNGLD
ncbi:MAG: hypothetical protein AABX61_01555 [Nanoarchaeota archaeon]